MKKILLINGSPNEHGNTACALDELEKVLNSHDIDTERLWLGKEPVQDCISCYRCMKTGKCVFDDEVNRVIEKMDSYCGIVIGSPVYFAGPSGRLCSFLDRLFWAGGKKTSGKIGAAIVCCRRGGASAALDRLNKYLTYGNMTLVGSNYWNMVYGMKAGEAQKDLEGMQTIRTLGENMAWLLGSMDAQTGAALEYEKKIFTNFIR